MGFDLFSMDTWIIENSQSKASVACPQADELFTRREFESPRIFVVEDRCVLLPITLDPADERAAMRRLPPEDCSSPSRAGPIQEAWVGLERVAVVNAGSIQAITQT